MNSPLHATGTTFPFTERFTGCGWNCRSLYAYEKLNTIRHVEKIAAQHDFACLFETRETLVRKANLDHHLQAEHMYYSSFIDQYKGGVGLVVKRSFLQNFAQSEWEVITRGRIGRLKMSGEKGSLHIYVVYLDPDCHKQKIESIKALGAKLDPRAHSLIIGDFNFVESDCDRFLKSTGAWSGNNDQEVAKAWASNISSKGIAEWAQPEFTCETGLVFSRIDRVYSSLHAVHNLTDRITCSILDKVPDLSDHWPISFGLRPAVSNESTQIPTWVLNHPNFGAEVFAEFQFNATRSSMDSFTGLRCFKDSVRSASRYIKKICKEHPASSIDEKISASMGFLRALKCGDAKAALRFQRIYSRLRDVDISPWAFGTPAFKVLQDHIIELTHTSVKERIESLRNDRSNLPEFIYAQRKENILRKLRRLLPGSSGNINAVKDPLTDTVTTDPLEIADILTNYWQTVFDKKDTDAALRSCWIRRLTQRLKVSLEDLLPSRADVDLVLDNLPSSASGPDGIPFAVFSRFREIVAPIILDITHGMIEGRLRPDDDFNLAFLICLPKGAGEKFLDGAFGFEPSSTRPLSVVDASNRIIASVFRVALERCAASWVSKAQRGFLPGRQMLRNILDVDFAAQKISVKTTKGAILLFDFKSAFPSMCHDFIWDALLGIGLPQQYIKALKMFYANNKHFMRTESGWLESVTVRSGVRQGCPLSPLLFALCADILLRELSVVLMDDEVVRAFADDTAVVIANYEETLPKLQMLFKEFEAISALALNIKKTVFIPLWNNKCLADTSRIVSLACPDWGGIAVSTHGKYLGFMIGPGAGQSSWTKPLDKFVARAGQWASLHLGLFYNMTIFRPFIASVLTFVMQLEPLPDEFHGKYQEVLRRLAPGPGNWATFNDLTHLQSAYAFPLEFPDLLWTAQAIKLRAIETFARDCHKKQRELEQWQASHYRRPFGGWHSRSYFAILAQLEIKLRERGIHRLDVRKSCADGNMSFQRAAEAMIKLKFAETYYEASRLRQKMCRWSLTGVPRFLEERVLRNFKLLSSKCPPRVLASYFRALWNGWCTSRRMRTMAGHSGAIVPCSLCGGGQDSLEHYSLCEVFWSFCCKARPAGLGLAQSIRSREAFFLLVPGMEEDDCIRMAFGIYALFRTVIYCSATEERVNLLTMLRIHVHRAAEGSCSQHLLGYRGIVLKAI